MKISCNWHRMVWNPKFYYPLHKIPLFVSVLSHMNQAHPLPIDLLKILFKITLPSTRGLPIYFFLQVSPPKKSTILCPSNVQHAPPSSFTLFDHQNSIWLGMQTKKFLIMQSTPVSCYIVPLNSKYFPQNLQQFQPMK